MNGKVFGYYFAVHKLLGLCIFDPVSRANIISIALSLIHCGVLGSDSDDDDENNF